MIKMSYLYSREREAHLACVEAAAAVSSAKTNEERKIALLQYLEALENEESVLRFTSYSQSNPSAVMARRDNIRLLRYVESQLHKL